MNKSLVIEGEAHRGVGGRADLVASNQRWRWWRWVPGRGIRPHKVPIGTSPPPSSLTTQLSCCWRMCCWTPPVYQDSFFPVAEASGLSRSAELEEEQVGARVLKLANESISAGLPTWRKTYRPSGAGWRCLKGRRGGRGDCPASPPGIVVGGAPDGAPCWGVPLAHCWLWSAR